MIPDDVEKIIMTKEDYDRNVEQLLYDKIYAELEIERLHSIIKEAKDYINSTGYGTDFTMSAEEVDRVYEILDKEKNKILD